MPLSDHEQRLLEQMERALYAEDPKFADSLRKTRRPNIDRTRLALGIGGVIAGLAIILAGVATSIVAIGVLGFVVMLSGAFVAYRAVNRPAPDTTKPAEGRAAPKASKRSNSGGFMERMEERWRRRRDQRGQF